MTRQTPRALPGNPSPRPPRLPAATPDTDPARTAPRAPKIRSQDNPSSFHPLRKNEAGNLLIPFGLLHSSCLSTVSETVRD